MASPRGSAAPGRPRLVTLEVVVPREREDDAVCALWECGTLGVQVIDGSGDACMLVASFAETEHPEQRLREALATVPGASIRPVDLPEVDWVVRFRQEFRAFAASGFTVVPEWDGRPPGRDVLVVSPGRAFGTGTHETTRLCLALLVGEAKRRPLGRVADVGAGTGLLALAALRLGAGLAVAVDLDAEATSSAALHARLNELPLHVVQGDGGRALGAGRFDLVLANLMAPLLVERARELAALCRSGAVLVLSGLLAGDVDEVASTYAPLGRVQSFADGEWVALRVGLG